MDTCFAPLSTSWTAALQQLLTLLQSHQRSNDPDMLIWDLHSSDLFTSKSSYISLQPSGPTNIPVLTIWRASGTLKDRITMWLSILDCLPTCDYLHRRYIRPLVCFVVQFLKQRYAYSYNVILTNKFGKYFVDLTSSTLGQLLFVRTAIKITIFL